MRGTRLTFGISVLGGLMTLLLGAGIHPTSARAAMALYQDPRTGAVYTKKCRTCIFMGNFVPAPQIEQSVTQATQAQMDTERAQMTAQFQQQQAQQQQWNAEMATQVSAMQPAWRDYADRWYKKISFGTLVYAYYGYWNHTGFGPQFMDANMQWPGPGNNGYNEFGINRTYLDFRFTPDDNFTMRITPDMYANLIGGSPASTGPVADKVGNNTAWNQTSDGNLNLRLKYAYLDYNTLFKKILRIGAMREDKITFGQQQNPLVDWEENLWGYRYTTLTPWNYLSLSSAQVGLAIKGPIKFHELQYADYDVGAYDDANYHQVEQSSNKQVMGRLTINPLGARTRYDSLGMTGFFDYAYPNKASDGQFTGFPPKAGIGGTDSAYAHSTRIAGLLHYTAETWGLIGEFDYGHNAFNANNLFSGSGPADNFTGLSSLAGPTSYANWTKMAQTYQNASTSVQIGWDFLGHVDIPRTPFTLFGLYQQMQPNMQVSKNPLDFYRFDLGVQWLISKNLRIAIDDQHLTYYHSQFTTTTADLQEFAPIKLSAPITSSVPVDTNVVLVNLEFKY